MSFSLPIGELKQYIKNKFKDIFFSILSTKQKYVIIEILNFCKIDFITGIFAKEKNFIHKRKKIIEISKIYNLDLNSIHYCR